MLTSFALTIFLDILVLVHLALQFFMHQICPVSCEMMLHFSFFKLHVSRRKRLLRGKMLGWMMSWMLRLTVPLRCAENILSWRLIWPLGLQMSVRLILVLGISNFTILRFFLIIWCKMNSFRLRGNWVNALNLFNGTKIESMS